MPEIYMFGERGRIHALRMFMIIIIIIYSGNRPWGEMSWTEGFISQISSQFKLALQVVSFVHYPFSLGKEKIVKLEHSEF